MTSTYDHLCAFTIITVKRRPHLTVSLLLDNLRVRIDWGCENTQNGGPWSDLGVLILVGVI